MKVGAQAHERLGQNAGSNRPSWVIQTAPHVELYVVAVGAPDSRWCDDDRRPSF
jgi:hypothetical protein